MTRSDDEGPVSQGAMHTAPTAPHATAPPPGSKLSRAAKFWYGRSARRALVVALVVSAGAHLAAYPWRLVPQTSVEFKEVDDELTIPSDLFEEEKPQAPEPTPPPPVQPPPSQTGDGIADAAAPKVDAGPDAGSDAGPRDAGPDAAKPPKVDAGIPLAHGDGGAPAELRDGGTSLFGDGGAMAMADGGSGAAPGPRDPASIVGMSGLVTAGPVNVTLLVNMTEIRKNPVGARSGPLFTSVPQWNDFLKGNQGSFDPVRDADWLLIYGPSLIHTDRDAVIIRYTIDDAVVDHAMDIASQNYDKGGPLDAGVRGVKGTLGHADGAPRAFLRGQPHVLAVVPPDKATEFAKVLKGRPIAPKVRPGEAMRLIVREPHRQVAIRGLKFPQDLKELRIWINPRPDGGADVFAEGDCTTPESAVAAAATMSTLITQTNSGLVQMGTAGVLNGAKVEADGTLIHTHVVASKTQLERILGTAALLMGVELKP